MATVYSSDSDSNATQNGGATYRAGNVTGTGNFNAAPATFQPGALTNASPNASAQEGKLIFNSGVYRKSVASGATATVGHLECFDATANNTILDCGSQSGGSVSANQAFVGVLSANAGASYYVQTAGTVTVSLDTTYTYSAGDFVCISTTAVGQATMAATGVNPCTNAQVGFAAAAGSAVNTVSVFLHLGGTGGTGGGSSTINNAAQYAAAYYSAAGSSNTISGIAAPTTPNGVPQFLASTPASGAATAGAWLLPGIAGRAVTGTTSTDTIVTADCSPNRVEYVGSVAVAVTLPTATTLAVPSCVMRLVNATTGTNTNVTVTPTTWTVNGNSTLVIAEGQVAFLDV